LVREDIDEQEEANMAKVTAIQNPAAVSERLAEKEAQ
jgi:hypothetical protein